MSKRRVEVFSAGCALCNETVGMVRRIACDSCEVEVLDIRDPAVVARAKTLAIRTVPALVIDGVLPKCCAANAGPDETVLRASGLGVPLP